MFNLIHTPCSYIWTLPMNFPCFITLLINPSLEWWYICMYICPTPPLFLPFYIELSICIHMYIKRPLNMKRTLKSNKFLLKTEIERMVKAYWNKSPFSLFLFSFSSSPLEFAGKGGGWGCGDAPPPGRHIKTRVVHPQSWSQLKDLGRKEGRIAVSRRR